MNYKITTASLSEIKLMLSWARQEGWNPGLNDPLLFQLADPKGFFIGYLEEEPIAAISNVKYSDNFSFLGLYIVHPGFRSQGFGFKIWQHALHYSGKASCGLDGVVAQQDNYKKSGFRLAYRNIRYTLKANNLTVINDNRIIPITNIPVWKLIEFDRRFFPAARTSWLMSWVFDGHTLVSYENGQINGYGTIRKCHEGYKIGPLIAENRKIAETIFLNLCIGIESNSPVFLDIPEPNMDAVDMVNELTMNPVFETARMYTNAIPNLDLSKIFGVTTFELG